MVEQDTASGSLSRLGGSIAYLLFGQTILARSKVCKMESGLASLAVSRNTLECRPKSTGVVLHTTL